MCNSISKENFTKNVKKTLQNMLSKLYYKCKVNLTKKSKEFNYLRINDKVEVPHGNKNSGTSQG